MDNRRTWTMVGHGQWSGMDKFAVSCTRVLAGPGPGIPHAPNHARRASRSAKPTLDPGAVSRSAGPCSYTSSSVMPSREQGTGLGALPGVRVNRNPTSESYFDKSSQSVPAQVSERAGEQKSRNAQPVSQSTPVVTGSLIDRLRAGTVFGGMGTTDTPTTVQVPLASNASSTPDAEHRMFQEYCCALLNSSPYTRDGEVDN